MYHTGDAILAGISELRPLIDQLVSDVVRCRCDRKLDCARAIGGYLRDRISGRAVRKRVLYAAPPLVACWSLMTFYHLTYGFVILLPVMMLLALNDTRRSDVSRLGRSPDARLFWPCCCSSG